MPPADTVIASHQLRAFCGAEDSHLALKVNGNPCDVTILASSPPQVPRPSGLTHCLSWSLGKRNAAIRCWSPAGEEIQLCGHGLLCSAYIWMEQWGEGGTLHMHGCRVSCDRETDTVWLQFEAPALTDCEVPHWCELLFGQRAVGCAISGPENGYLILEWPAELELRQLPRPGKALAEHTQRAIIITRQTLGSEAALADIHYRYFAPQYGVDEDTATGSAMRILASYWASLHTDGCLSAYQCSDDGGLLFSRLKGTQVWIGGRTAHYARETASFERRH